MAISKARTSTALAFWSFAALALQSTPALAQVDAPPGDQPGYAVIVPGLLAGPAASVRFESNGMRIQQQDLVMGRGEVPTVRFPLRALMELRGGGVTTALRGQVQNRVPGDFWEVARDEAIGLSNRGDVAVIRLLLIDDGQ